MSWGGQRGPVTSFGYKRIQISAVGRCFYSLYKPLLNFFSGHVFNVAIFSENTGLKHPETQRPTFSKLRVDGGLLWGRGRRGAAASGRGIPQAQGVSHRRSRPPPAAAEGSDGPPGSPFPGSVLFRLLMRRLSFEEGEL